MIINIFRAIAICQLFFYKCDALSLGSDIGDIVKPYLSLTGKIGSTADHFFVTGISSDSVSTVSVLKIDKKSLDILWKSDIGNIDRLEDTVFKVMSSGNSYLCGRSSNGFAGVSPGRYYCVRVSKNGEIQWVFELSNQGYQINDIDINPAESNFVIGGQTAVSTLTSSAFIANYNQTDSQVNVKWFETKPDYNLISSLFVDGSVIYISTETLSDVSTAAVRVQKWSLADYQLIWSDAVGQSFRPASIILRSNSMSGLFLAAVSSSNELITATISSSGGSQNVVKTGILVYPIIPFDYAVIPSTTEPVLCYIQNDSGKLAATKFSSTGQPAQTRVFSEYAFQWSTVQIRSEWDTTNSYLVVFFQLAGKLVYLQVRADELSETRATASNIDTGVILVAFVGLFSIIFGSVIVFFCVKTLGERARLREEMYKLQSASQLFDQQQKVIDSAKLSETIKTSGNTSKASLLSSPRNPYVGAQPISGNLFENNQLKTKSPKSTEQRYSDPTTDLKSQNPPSSAQTDPQDVRKPAALVSTREMPENLSSMNSEKSKSRSPTREKEAVKPSATVPNKELEVNLVPSQVTAQIEDQARSSNQGNDNVRKDDQGSDQLSPLAFHAKPTLKTKASFTENDSIGSKTSKKSEGGTMKAAEFTSTLSQVQTMISNQRELSLPGFLQYRQDVDFTLRQQIAKGGSASIFLGKILSGDMKARAYGSSLCIAKVLTVKEPSVDEIAMFGQEIAIMWFFRSSKNFVKLLGFTPTSPPIIIMKHYQHGSLTDLIYNDTQNISWTSNLIFRILRDVATGLKEMHEAGFIHCDMKPSNILIDEDDEGYYAVLTDFGISKVISNSVLLVEAFMVANIDGASVIYAAPEVLKHMMSVRSNSAITNGQTATNLNEDIVKARDVYAFSMVSYEVINRNQPWSRKKSSQEIVQRVLDGERPECTPEVVEKRKIDRKLASLCDLMEQCWADDPNARLQMKWIVEILDQMAQATAFKTHTFHT